MRLGIVCCCSIAGPLSQLAELSSKTLVVPYLVPSLPSFLPLALVSAAANDRPAIWGTTPRSTWFIGTMRRGGTPRDGRLELKFATLPQLELKYYGPYQGL